MRKDKAVINYYVYLESRQLILAKDDHCNIESSLQSKIQGRRTCLEGRRVTES